MALKSKLIKLLGLAEANELENRLKPSKCKVWKALLTQTGTNAPVATVLQSDFDDSAVEIGYSDIGVYTVYLPGMDVDNTIVNFSTDGEAGVMWFIHKSKLGGGANVVIYTASSYANADLLTFSDEMMTNVPISIEVYV